MSNGDRNRPGGIAAEQSSAAAGHLSEHGQRPTLLLVSVVVAGALAVVACSERSETRAELPGVEAFRRCEAAGVREVVTAFGERLKDVPTLTPDEIAVAEARDAYGTLVTPELLDAWTENPALAPGREVSSPWPERIEISSVSSGSEGSCRVEGEVIYVTSVELSQGGAAYREPVVFEVVEEAGEWRIGSYAGSGSPLPGSPRAIDTTDTALGVDDDTLAARSDPDADVAQAVDVLERYYAAINERDFAAAYALWGGDGTASGQTFEEFVAGFGETARVTIRTGVPGRVEPAAGSRYVEIPVTVEAETGSGREQRFEGSYTLRRSVVEGASEAQQRWHIYAASLEEMPPA